MNKANKMDRLRLIRILVILGLAIVSMCLIICLAGPILIFIKGILGFLAVVGIAAAVITLVDRMRSHKEIGK